MMQVPKVKDKFEYLLLSLHKKLLFKKHNYYENDRYLILLVVDPIVQGPLRVS